MRARPAEAPRRTRCPPIRGGRGPPASWPRPAGRPTWGCRRPVADPAARRSSASSSAAGRARRRGAGRRSPRSRSWRCRRRRAAVRVPLPGGADLPARGLRRRTRCTTWSPGELGEEAELLLSDRRGRVAASGAERSLASFPKELVARRCRPHSGAGRGADGQVLGAYAPVPDSDWVVLSRQPAAVAEAVACACAAARRWRSRPRCCWSRPLRAGLALPGAAAARDGAGAAPAGAARPPRPRRRDRRAAPVVRGAGAQITDREASEPSSSAATRW